MNKKELILRKLKKNKWCSFQELAKISPYYMGILIRLVYDENQPISFDNQANGAEWNE